MTRLDRSPDPKPARVFEATLAQGILLWEDSLSETERAEWIHRRVWGRTHGELPLEFMAFVTAKAALSLYQEPDWKPEGVVESVHDYAREYLFGLFRIGFGFRANVQDLGDTLALNYSPCIDLQKSFRGGMWYIVGLRERVNERLLSANEDPVLVRFIERFKKIYPDVVDLIQGAEEPGRLFDALRHELQQDFSDELERKRGTSSV